MASSAADLVRKLDRLATTVDRGKTAAIGETAMVVKAEMLLGPSRSGIRPTTRIAGAKWGVGFELKPKWALVSYRGPLHWAEWGTQAHVIGAKQLGSRASIRNAAGFRTASGSTRGAFGGARGGKGKRALVIPGAATPKAWAWHPGARARPFWDATRKRAQESGSDEYRRVLNRQIRKSGFGAFN